MSEAELHILRARLDGGIRNKAARGELRRGLPLGFVWGEARRGKSASTPMLPSAAPSVPSSTASRARLRTPRLALVSQRGPAFPDPGRAEPARSAGARPTYTAIHRILVNPVYAGAYAYGRTRHERRIDEQGSGPQARPAFARERMGRAHPRSSPRLYRLVDVRGQSRSHRWQHQAKAAPKRWRGPGRFRLAPGHRHLRPLWPPTAHPLSRHASGAGLPLCRQAHRQWPWCLLLEYWRRADRPRHRPGDPHRRHAGRCRCRSASCRTARGRR